MTCSISFSRRCAASNSWRSAISFLSSSLTASSWRVRSATRCWSRSLSLPISCLACRSSGVSTTSHLPLRAAIANWCVRATSRISLAPLVARGYEQSATMRLPAMDALSFSSYSEKARHWSFAIRGSRR
jgi:hypothetical protein